MSDEIETAIKKRTAETLKLARSVVKTARPTIEEDVKRICKNTGVPVSVAMLEIMSDCMADLLSTHPSIVTEIQEAREQFRRFITDER